MDALQDARGTTAGGSVLGVALVEAIVHGPVFTRQFAAPRRVQAKPKSERVSN